ncbi:LADA_0G04390g1_1 [Lachancea dasiensis]|uniref:LADA_0G04390g1_1 n=1 Tax=Lachancea dasiensis TaxID=1072105 RepID=A0A1G4JS46_9SACH|nr:LADA_0G04390g1_1 [Lachancea dasiensis]
MDDSSNNNDVNEARPLENLFERLGSDHEFKNSIKQELQNVQNSILPMRLHFNELLNAMASIDAKQESSALERFTYVRTKLLEFMKDVDTLSSDYVRLQPLFDGLQQASKDDNISVKFSPLERLSNINDAALATAGRPQSGKRSNVNSPSALAAASTTKSAVSSGNTPSSNLPTPSTTASAAAKKPRKPRTKKNSGPSPSSMPSQPQPPSQALQQAIHQQQPAQSMQHQKQFTPSTNPSQLLSGMSPMNIMSSPLNTMSPVNGSNMSFPPGGKPSNMHSVQRHVQPSQPSFNSNSITPANILSMSMSDQSNPAAAYTQMNPQGSVNQDLGSLDLNNIDLSNLNMDFLQ